MLDVDAVSGRDRAGTAAAMSSEPGPEDRRPSRGTSADPAPAAADKNPEHDPTTSREAHELEMAEEGRSEEAGRQGKHID